MAALQQQQQLRNEATKMAMKIPLFYGNDKEDTMNIKDFIHRFEVSCEAMGLNNDGEKCRIFGSYLRGKATALWKVMEHYRINDQVWAEVKDYFLTRYKGKPQPDALVHKMTRLSQDKNESVNDFATRCITEIGDMTRICGNADDRDVAPEYLALTEAQRNRTKNGQMRVVTDMFAKAFFLTGVSALIKTDLINLAPATMSEAITEAMKLEQTMETASGSKTKIAFLADMEDSELEEEELDEDTISALNKKRAQFGRQPFKRANRFQNSKGSGGYKRADDKPAYTCYYCHKPGHMQLNCNSRKQKNAPMVDRNGKVLKNQGNGNQRNVSEVEGKTDPQVNPEIVRHLRGSMGDTVGVINDDQQKNLIDLNYV